jgi:hypothetical protein
MIAALRAVIRHRKVDRPKPTFPPEGPGSCSCVSKLVMPMRPYKSDRAATQDATMTPTPFSNNPDPLSCNRA